MGRKRKDPEEKRLTIAVTMKAKDLERLDKYLVTLNQTITWGKIGRSSFLEGMALEFLESEGV